MGDRVNGKLLFEKRLHKLPISVVVTEAAMYKHQRQTDAVLAIGNGDVSG
jgi:hypothetical protein